MGKYSTGLLYRRCLIYAYSDYFGLKYATDPQNQLCRVQEVLLVENTFNSLTYCMFNGEDYVQDGWLMTSFSQYNQKCSG